MLVVIFGSPTALATYVAFSSGAGVRFAVTPELQRASVLAMGVRGVLALTTAALMCWGFWKYHRAVRPYDDDEFRDARQLLYARTSRPRAGSTHCGDRCAAWRSI